jgi:ADP-heptose:LPS heptosyltransferase
MNKILVIDPGKGWGQFVSKMYCYQKLADHLNSKIVFLTKKSTQAEHYLKSLSFCEDVIYIERPKKGIKHTFSNIKSIIKNIKRINQINFDNCYVFHPSLRYLFIAYFSNIKEIWGLGFKFQRFFFNKK